MEFITCSSCCLHYEWSNDLNDRVTKKHLATTREYYCYQLKKTLLLVDNKDHFKVEEHKNTKRMWYCEACEKMSIILKDLIVDLMQT